VPNSILARALPQTPLRGAYIALLDPLDGFKGPTCKGGGLGNGGEEKGLRGGEGKG